MSTDSNITFSMGVLLKGPLKIMRMTKRRLTTERNPENFYSLHTNIKRSADSKVSNEVNQLQDYI